MDKRLCLISIYPVFVLLTIPTKCSNATSTMHYKYIPCLLMHAYADHRDNARAYSSLSYNEIKINIVLNNDAISQINLITGSSSMIYVLVRKEKKHDYQFLFAFQPNQS